MRTPHRTSKLALATIAGGVVGASVLAGVASAHITPDPSEAPAGSTQQVGFTVEHGCGDSPTIQLDMRLPQGAADATPLPPEGWTGEVTENDEGDTIVTFAGGPLGADVAGTFTVELTLPSTPDVSIYFPFVQTCEVGELRWIDIPDDGSGDDLDEPAPAMALTAPVETTTTAAETATTTAAPETTTTPATTAAPDSTAAPETTATTTAAETTVPETTSAPTDPTTTAAAAADDGDDGGSAAGWIVGGVLAVAVLGGGAVWLTRRNQE